MAFFRILFGRRLPAELAGLLPEGAAPPPRALEAPAAEQPAGPAPEKQPAAIPAPPARPDPGPGALQLLALLQREGRLVDFLSEEIETYADADIGAAVRDIHRGCRKVLLEHFTMEPVLAAAEDENVVLDRDFDPGRVRLTGNLGGQPPFRGTLRHHGWKATKVAMPILADGMDATVVAPAEVEL